MRSRRAERILGQAKRSALFLIIILASMISASTFIWAILSSFKTSTEILRVPLIWIPASFYVGNYETVLQRSLFLSSFLNSAIVSALVTASVIVTSLMTGYALAKLEFFGKEALFRYVLLTLTLPSYLTVIPLFLIVVRLGWVDTFLALIIPAIVSSYSIFLVRQYAMTIPDEFIEAARVDGANELDILLTIVFPLCMPALTIIALWTFINTWGDFLWPLLVINDQRLYTIPLYMASLQRMYGDPRYMGEIMAGSVLAAIPSLLVLIVGFKYIVKGVTVAGLKK